MTTAVNDVLNSCKTEFISRIKRSINSEKVAGKVVLITGASSGIGEFLAYEYARRGACLALSARREERLRAVADKARELGSPDVIVVITDISKVEDCERFVNEAMNHFGKLDHLVTNAGVAQIDMFEDCKQISDFATTMNTNFWGSVYASHFAIPHLRKSKGRIVGISSIAGWCSMPRTSFYSGQMDFVLAESTERCAKAIVDSACRGDRYLVEPSWARITFLIKVLCPEVVEWWLHSMIEKILCFEHLAYEYDRRGACLALVGRSKESLTQVAAMAELIVAPFLPIPRLSFYDASEAAVYSIRIRISEIGITIVIPGLIKSEMTREKILNQQVKLELKEEMRRVNFHSHDTITYLEVVFNFMLPLITGLNCLLGNDKSDGSRVHHRVCQSNCRWCMPSIIYFKYFCPDTVEWSNCLLLILTISI
uniref:Uncharacterized protein n=1 Tax=Salix viminalis TaxID=40686 RepID=A0A6N2NEU3_SALVM